MHKLVSDPRLEHRGDTHRGSFGLYIHEQQRAVAIKVRPFG
jgi:hypothetical protein